MRKRLVLMSALFAGTMVVNNGFCSFAPEDLESVRNFSTFEKFPGKHWEDMKNSNIEGKFKNTFDHVWEENLSLENLPLGKILSNSDVLMNLQKNFEGKSCEEQKQEDLQIALQKAQVLHEHYQSFIVMFNECERSNKLSRSDHDTLSPYRTDFKYIQEHATIIDDFLQKHEYKDGFSEIVGNASSESTSEPLDLPALLSLIHDSEKDWMSALKNLKNIDRKGKLSNILLSESQILLLSLHEKLSKNSLVLQSKYDEDIQKLTKDNENLQKEKASLDSEIWRLQVDANNKIQQLQKDKEELQATNTSLRECI